MQVWVREVELGLGILEVAFVREGRVVVLGGDGAEIATLGEKEVEDYLCVKCPVTRIVEDEYGVYFEGVACVVGGVVAR